MWYSYLLRCLRMYRHQAIRVIMEQVDEEIVVSNIGDPSKEVYHIRDRSKNFYMLGSLGLASSISLGLALSQDRKVICLDGDGSLLMNLGSLATIANQSPRNLTLIVLDNGSYGSTGNQKSYTSGLTNLSDVAKACGIENVFIVKNKTQLNTEIKKCLKRNKLCFIHVHIRPDNSKFGNIPLTPIEIKNRFMNNINKG